MDIHDIVALLTIGVLVGAAGVVITLEVLTRKQRVRNAGRWVKHNLETGKVEDIKFSDKCWDCGGKRFIEGPSGGLCTNVKCASCGSEFNTNPFEGIFERIKT